jgi:hypothetical protein
MSECKSEMRDRGLSRRIRGKLIARRFICWYLYYCGVLKATYSLLGRNKAIILFYHRVIDLKEMAYFPQSGMWVSRKTFDLHMRFYWHVEDILARRSMLSYAVYYEKW